MVEEGERPESSAVGESGEGREEASAVAEGRTLDIAHADRDNLD